MSSLIGRFERDLIYLEQGLSPQEVSGKNVKDLDYEGEDHEKLTDDDVRRLAIALKDNKNFSGPLDLSKNDLTDQAALYLSKAISSSNGATIQKLNLSKNKFTGKAGEFIGQALLEKKDCDLYKLQFKKINLEQVGLVRVLEAANASQKLAKLDIGIITDSGLRVLAEKLADNKFLEELCFEETSDHQQYWSEEGRAMFTQMLKQHTVIKKIKVTPFKREDGSGEEEADNFKREIDFFTNNKTQEQEKWEKFQKRANQCDPTNMFENMLKLVEDKDKRKKMNVRKFFNNTFGQVLNNAMFQLKKKQDKEQDNEELFTHQGAIKFVAHYLQTNLPDGELQNLGDSSDEA